MKRIGGMFWLLTAVFAAPFAFADKPMDSFPPESGLRGTAWIRSDWGGGPAGISINADGKSFAFKDNRGIGYIVSCTKAPIGYSYRRGWTTWLLQILASDGSYDLMVFHVGDAVLRIGYSFYTPDDLGEYIKQ
jgi:hypothetical protein